MLSRRSFINAAGAATALATLGLPRMAFARTAGERRFVFIIQRGAADGLSIVAPTGDPSFASIRGDFTDLAGGAKLGSFFTLHPALAETAKMYADKQALFVHAVASPYRDRSHFDGQNVLETGGSAAYRVKDGWMNRMLGLVPAADAKALALSSTVPMALRGSHEVSSYAVQQLASPSDDLLTRVGSLYESDPQLHQLWTAAMQTRMEAGSTMQSGGGQKGAATGALAAKMLAGADVRIAMIETNGWDTHSGQKGRLNAQLKDLDQLLAALKTGLAGAWENTLVVVATEFGRTVHPNGTGGTDHGQASAAMLLGGAVDGGRVVSDWPGLTPAALYEGRDLKPTTDLDALIAGALAQHYALEPSRTMTTLFPESSGRAFAQPLVIA